MKRPGACRAFAMAGRAEARPQSESGRLDVGRLLALGAGGHVETDALAFDEALEALALDRGEMGEEILTPILRRNEAKTLRVIKPLNNTFQSIRHTSTPSNNKANLNASGFAPFTQSPSPPVARLTTQFRNLERAAKAGFKLIILILRMIRWIPFI